MAGQGAAGQGTNQAAQAAQLQNVLNGGYSVNPSANPYMGQTTNVGQNQYAGQNPYLGQMVNQAQQNIVDSYNKNTSPALAAQFASNGAFGGSAYNDAMQQSQNTLA